MPFVLEGSGNFLSDDYYLMFELISDRFKIVVDYSKKEGYTGGVYLIGARRKADNYLLNYEDVQYLGKLLKLPTMKIFNEFQSIDDLVKNAKELSVLDEGYVMRFENGIMAKVKGDKYLAAHRFISKLSPKYILESMALGVEQELIRIAPEEYRTDVESLIAEFTQDKQIIEETVNELFITAPKETRKDFALWVQANVSEQLRGLMFAKLDNKPITMKKVYKIIGEQKKITAETKI